MLMKILMVVVLMEARMVVLIALIALVRIAQDMKDGLVTVYVMMVLGDYTLIVKNLIVMRVIVLQINVMVEILMEAELQEVENMPVMVLLTLIGSQMGGVIVIITMQIALMVVIAVSLHVLMLPMNVVLSDMIV
jgi:hypothetical protein